jgi:hypothetical protein
MGTLTLITMILVTGSIGGGLILMICLAMRPKAKD